MSGLGHPLDPGTRREPGVPYSASRRSRNSRGVAMRTLRRRRTGKCLALPVTRKSAPDANATSTNISSAGSGRRSLSGAARVGSPIDSTKSNTLSTDSRSKPNRPRVSTSRYSDRIRSSQQSVTSSVRTDRRIAAGGPLGERNPDTKTLVSRTIFNRSTGACGMIRFPHLFPPRSGHRALFVQHPAATCSAHRSLGTGAVPEGILRKNSRPSRSGWRLVFRCS